MTSTQTIGVIGAGTMGTGIAQACVVAGLSVVTIDLDEERVTREARQSRIAWSGR
jgi:3-hydroxybutyryl-CoA dehydrogenase